VAREWGEFLGAVKGMVGSGLGNRLTLMLLDEQLDEASKVMLKARRRANPDLPYMEFFAELCQEFAEDSFLSQRSKWKRVRLERSAGKVTLMQWRKVKAQLFDALRGGGGTTTPGRFAGSFARAIARHLARSGHPGGSQTTAQQIRGVSGHPPLT
jgi:hypothetical protein